MFVTTLAQQFSELHLTTINGTHYGVNLMSGPTGTIVCLHAPGDRPAEPLFTNTDEWEYNSGIVMVNGDSVLSRFDHSPITAVKLIEKLAEEMEEDEGSESLLNEYIQLRQQLPSVYNKVTSYLVIASDGRPRNGQAPRVLVLDEHGAVKPIVVTKATEAHADGASMVYCQEVTLDDTIIYVNPPHVKSFGNGEEMVVQNGNTHAGHIHDFLRYRKNIEDVKGFNVSDVKITAEAEPSLYRYLFNMEDDACVLLNALQRNLTPSSSAVLPPIPENDISVIYEIINGYISLYDVSSRTIYLDGELNIVSDEAESYYTMDAYPKVVVSALSGSICNMRIKSLLEEGVTFEGKGLVLLRETNPSDKPVWIFEEHTKFSKGYIEAAIKIIISKADDSYRDYINYFN